MKNRYLVTGGTGHLGNTIINMLINKGEHVSTLILPSDKNVYILSDKVKIFRGDVRDKNSIAPAFSTEEDEDLIVIHTAGIVSIATKFDQAVFDVNVTGTKNIIELCTAYNVKKFVHVSSVHAIPERPNGDVITEVTQFNPDAVEGLYAKTKAQATALVLNAAKSGLDACVVHPSGITGPFDYGAGHITQLVTDFYNGSLTAGIDGGYDFVDVRDVAKGIISCCQKGKSGECYILSNNYYSIKDLFSILHKITGKKAITTILPMWFVKGTIKLSELYYKVLKKTPLYTSYSLYTLSSNANFSHEKASRELGYTTRSFDHTIKDTVEWLKSQKRLK